jgi:hypothetical protein
MLKPVLVVAVAVAALCLGAPGAGALVQTTTWDQAAGTAGFPVYKPARTLGLRARAVTLNPCGLNRSFVTAAWGAQGAQATRRPRVDLFESSPDLCGNPGESHTVKTVRIHGVRARLNVYCSHSFPKCLHDRNGFRHGYLLVLRERRNRATTWVVLESFHVHEAGFLRYARSLRVRDLSRCRSCALDSARASAASSASRAPPRSPAR